MKVSKTKVIEDAISDVLTDLQDQVDSVEYLRAKLAQLQVILREVKGED